MTAPGGMWPDPTQELLLRAIVSPDPVGRAALDRWWSSIDLDEIDGASFRLLPTLYASAVRNGWDLPSDRIRGIHRQSWYRNQLQMRVLADVLADLADAHVRTALTKGAALLQRYLPDVGARPMSDVDVVVPSDQVGAAVGVLLAAGWEPESPVTSALERFSHSVPFHHPDGWELDLHWHVLPAARHRAAARSFWSATTPHTVGAAPTELLHPSDELLVTVVHGLEWNVVPPVRWVADAHAILASGLVDPERLVEQAVALGVVLPLRTGLAYLTDVYAVDVDAAVTEGLAGARVPLWQLLEAAAKARPWTSAWAPGVLLLLRYLRSQRGDGVRRTLAGLPAFVAWRLGVDRPAQLPSALRRYTSRLAHRRRDLVRASVEQRGVPDRVSDAGSVRAERRTG